MTQTVSQEKWEKGKGQILELQESLENDPNGELNYKRLEQVRGFLCHLSMTFEIITPFLKGFPLTLCAHLLLRNNNGWKLPDRAFMAYIHEKQDLGLLDESEARAALNPPDYEDIPVPKKIKPVSRFKDDLFALSELMSSKEPPLVIVHSNSVYEMYYGFGDTSGKGFGSTTLSSKGIKHQVGLWGSDDESESSN